MPSPDLNNLRRTLEQASWEIESLEERLKAQNPVEFCEKVLGFVPTEYQRKVLLDPSRFLCLRWSRQSGKTVTVSALILWTALTRPGSCIAVVAPSLRQSKYVLKRIADFARRLPRGRVRQIQKMRIDFTDGSVIEAFPNNPNTIRGPSLNLVYCDEMNFIRDDEDLYDAVLFTISTTGGSFIASSTPGSKENLFYKICNDPTFSRSHVTWKDAVAPKGPLRPDVLDTIREQLKGDPWRWQREMEAEFAEDEQSFFSLKLITSAVDQDLSYWDFAERIQGRSLYVGVDFGKHRDHSVVTVVDYDVQTKTSSLVHMKQFALETDYDVVIGYVKALTERWSRVVRITTDSTGVGDSVTADMRKAGIGNIWPVPLTVPAKTNILENLRGMLVKKQLKLVHDPELFGEMNCEKFELNKSGQLLFSHPAGTHDDRLWAFALACHGLRYGISIPEYHPVAAVSTNPNLQRAPWRGFGVQWLRQLTQGTSVGRTGRIEWCYACNHAKVPGTEHTCPGQPPR